MSSIYKSSHGFCWAAAGLTGGAGSAERELLGSQVSPAPNAARYKAVRKGQRGARKGQRRL
jgi:hypothetical protein